MGRRGPMAGGTDEGSLMALLSREDDRRLRAQAWRHIRRINPTVTRTVWVKHRRRQRVET